MTALLVIMLIFMVALVVDQLALSERCHKLEMKLRGYDHIGGRKHE